MKFCAPIMIEIRGKFLKFIISIKKNFNLESPINNLVLITRKNIKLRTQTSICKQNFGTRSQTLLGNKTISDFLGRFEILFCVLLPNVV